MNPNREEVLFSPDERLFAATSDGGFARVWDTANWKEKATLGGFLNGVHSVAFSPDGERLATGSVGKEAVKLWDTESRQNLLTLGGQGAIFFSTAFSSDGNAIGSLNVDGVLHLWRAPSWDEIRAAEARDKTDSQQSLTQAATNTQ